MNNIPASYSSNEMIKAYAESARQFQVDDMYRYVLLVAALQAFFTLLVGLCQSRPHRGRIFNQEFLNENFGEEHSREIGGSIMRNGFPDMGDGRYSMVTEYKDWF